MGLAAQEWTEDTICCIYKKQYTIYCGNGIIVCINVVAGIGMRYECQYRPGLRCRLVLHPLRFTVSSSYMCRTPSMFKLCYESIRI